MRRSRLIGSLAACLIAGCGGQAAPSAPPAADPGGPRAHFAASTAGAETVREGRHATARLRRRVVMRAAPGGRPMARLGRRTEFGSPHVLAVVGRRGNWLRVVSAAAGNRRRGWIPSAAARLGATDYSIRVDRSARTAVLRRGSRTVLRFPVAVGRPGNETPLGRFAVTDKLRPRGPGSPYGCCAIALSGRQPRLEPGWPGGDRLAIHGTPQPATVGRAASLGCMRARARHLRVLMRRVPLGAPVIVRA